MTPDETTINGRTYRLGKCRSCPKMMLWAVNETTGRPVPLDPAPVPDGNIIVTGQTDTERGSSPVVRVLRKAEDPGPVLLYISHFATCPKAGAHRAKAANR